MSRFYTIVIYTAGEKNYANAVCDAIDPHKNKISLRIFRENCISINSKIIITSLKVG